MVTKHEPLEELSMSAIEVRCVCFREEHKDIRAVTDDWKPIEDMWPGCRFVDEHVAE